jgi:hypothetical protein
MKRFQALKLIYNLIGDDFTIDKKIFQAPNSEWADQNPDVKIFDVA